MIGVKDLVVGADGDDVELVPDILALFRRHRADGLVVIRNSAAQVLEQDVGELARELAGRLPFRLEAECLRYRAELLLAEDWQLEAPLCDELHREQELAGMCAVLGDACGRTAQQVAGHDDIGIRTADAARTLLRDLARPHIAVLAADAGEAERTLRLLLVEAIEDCLVAELPEVLDHLAHSRVRCLLEDILFRGKCLAIGGDGRHVVIDTDLVVLARRMDVRAPVRMLARLQRALLVMVVMVMTVLVVMLMMMRVFLFRHNTLLYPALQINISKTYINSIFSYFLSYWLLALLSSRGMETRGRTGDAETLQYERDDEVQHETACKEEQRDRVAARLRAQPRDEHRADDACRRPGSQHAAVNGPQEARAEEVGQIGRHDGKATA